MSQQMDMYTLAHPEFYERLSRYAAQPEFRSRIAAHLCDGWTLTESEMWLHVRHPESVLRRQGFKIHVSATPDDALALLDIVTPICIASRTSFKCARDLRLLGILTAKGYSRGGAGKFITIYPSDDDAFFALLEALYVATIDTGLRGQYILSDRRYKDSSILHYRYGGIVPPERVRIDGSFETVLENPAGLGIVDVRRPYFSLPDWVADPFPDDESAAAGDSTIVGERFRVDGVLASSNRGGVYYGVDQSDGTRVVLKEARPFVGRVRRGEHVIDSSDLLEHEFDMLRRLEPLACAPRAIALVREWEHLFLIQERLDGRVLRNFASQHENLAVAYLRRRHVLEQFLPRLIYIGLQLVDIVERIHAIGVVIGDLSTTNVMVDPATLRLSLIDVESATALGENRAFERFAKDWATPGFARPGRRERPGLSPADDYYALGMVLYNVLMPTSNFFSLKPEAESGFLDELVGCGLPVGVRSAIQALLDGRSAQARDALTELQRTHGTPEIAGDGPDAARSAETVASGEKTSSE